MTFAVARPVDGQHAGSGRNNISDVRFALPAGALADIVDRRRLLIAAEVFALAGAAGLAAITLARG